MNERACDPRRHAAQRLLAADAIAEERADHDESQAEPEEDLPAIPRSRFDILMRRAASRARAKVAWSTLPPEQTTATARPFTGSLPVSAAASATAPPGSTTSLNSRKAVSMASSTSSSVTTRPGPSSCLAMRKGDVARRRRQQGIADRARELVVLLLGAGGERAREVVEARGLAGVHAGAGAEPLHGERDAGRQAAARAGRGHGIERDAQRLGLLDDLQAGRALAGQDPGMVVGRHDRGAGLLGDAHADLFAAVLDAVVQHDLGARGLGVGDLERGRVGRHDDGGLHAHQARGLGEALRVVARRPADDALLAVGLAHRGEEIVGAAQLERAGALQALGLDEEAPAQPRVDARVLEQRRADGDALEAAGGG